MASALPPIAQDIPGFARTLPVTGHDEERKKVRAAYNHAQYLPERRRMMQQWADCLDDLAEDGKVIVHHFGRTA